MQFLDAETRRQLGFDQIWSQIRPVSPLGRLRHRKTIAYLPEQSAELKKELDVLEKLCNDLKKDPHMAEELLYLLSMVRDLSATCQRSLQGFVLDDQDFYEIKKLLLIFEKLEKELEARGWMFLFSSGLEADKELREALSIGQGTRESFYIADDYDEQLASLRFERAGLEGRLANQLATVEDKVMRAAGRNLSSEACLAISTRDTETIEQLKMLPELRVVEETPDFIKFCMVEDQELVQIKERLALVRALEEERKAEIRRWLTGIVKIHAPRLLRILERLAFLDLILAKAKFCAKIDGIKPQLRSDSLIRIEGGRHLLLEEHLMQRGQRYIPLCIELKPGVTMITGPNMGGKTVTLQTIGLLCAMAQYGLLVPATRMEFSPRRFIAAHLAEATIPKGLSAFAAEIAFLRDVIKESHEHGLVLIDEIAHGTNPLEGAGIAQAIIEKQQKQPIITVITTHYPSLAWIKGISHLRVKGLDRDALLKDEQVLVAGLVDTLHRLMDYRLEVATPEQVQRSDALIVAEALGLDGEIIARAKVIQEQGSAVHRRDDIDD
ncbi:MAG: hypothetical protein GX971_09300 [Firmicutes bacterium]|nr:hypothetical protein [Bacillota bacterium]